MRKLCTLLPDTKSADIDVLARLMQATVLMTRTVNLSPLPQTRDPGLQAAAVLINTSFARPEIAYVPVRRPISDKTSPHVVERCTQMAHPRLYKEHIVLERKVQVLNTVPS